MCCVVGNHNYVLHRPLVQNDILIRILMKQLLTKYQFLRNCPKFHILTIIILLKI